MAADVANLTEGDPLGKKWKDAFGYFLSADGTQLLYTVHDGSSGRVVLANADGSEPRFIAPELGYIYMAALSPTNDRVVFSGPARGYRLLIVALPDGKPLELTPEHPDCFVPQFTPDGKTIVFVRRDGDVYRVDADGKNLRRLTEGNRYVEFKLSAKDKHGSTDGPHISPDGKQIAYIAVKDGVPNVCVMNLDGREQRQLTFRKTPCGRVRWSPDGKQVAFVSFEGKYPQLFVVAAKGGEPRQLTRLDGSGVLRQLEAAKEIVLREKACGEDAGNDPVRQRNCFYQRMGGGVFFVAGARAGGWAAVGIRPVRGWCCRSTRYGKPGETSP